MASRRSRSGSKEEGRAEVMRRSASSFIIFNRFSFDGIFWPIIFCCSSRVAAWERRYSESARVNQCYR